MINPPHHTKWYTFKHAVHAVAYLLGAYTAISWVYVGIQKLRAPTIETVPFERTIVIKVPCEYRFDLTDGVNLKGYKNIGLTYYAKGEPTVPGVTMYSGRHVFGGAIAVSRDMLGKMVNMGDLIWLKATDQWYIVGDTMAANHQMRVDVFTHDMVLAKSGSSRTDIVIMRVPR